MGPRDLEAALLAVIPTGEPVYIEGPPGIGKTAIARQVAGKLYGGQDWQQHDWRSGDPDWFVDVRLSQHDPSDFKFPIVDQQARTVHWVQSLFPRDPDWKGVIMLDELSHAPPLLQTIALQLTQERRVGSDSLPTGAAVVAAGNRHSDRAGANRLLTSLVNRFVTLEAEHEPKEWTVWALRNGVHRDIIGYLGFKPPMLYDFRPNGGDQKAFPSPRSWERASNLLKAGIPDRLRHDLLTGCVGEGAAAEFVNYLEIVAGLPDLDKVLAKPDRAPVPNKPAACYAIAIALAERIKDSDNGVIANFVAYMERLRPEHAVLGVHTAVVNMEERFLACPEAMQFATEHRDMFLDEV